jgi:N-methylhydantoinase B/oxoprolinase/acetone carboxylase alpha subunit
VTRFSYQELTPWAQKKTLVPARMSILSDRRKHAPFGLAGGKDGKPGRNSIIRGGEAKAVSSKGTWDLEAGDHVLVETPGGGGFGALC